LSVKISRDEIITILRLVEQSSCDDFELNVGDTSLRLRKHVPQPEHTERALRVPTPSQVALDRPAAVPATEPASAPKEATSPKPREMIDGFQLKAPMLGIFYRSPTPGAPPFVEVGQTIAAGTTLCIIEVMKVMNTVKADRAGVIAAIYPDNAAMVEFGETIMVIRAEAAA
jgi:acetyl-CoA carboxylase biotin carboxyl carrier protein